MSFFSNLLKGLAVGGGAIAAPFTGGASLATILPAIGAGAGAAANAMAGNRGAKADAMLDQQRQMEALLLAREQEKRAARSSAYRDAMISNLGLNFRPATRPAGVTAPSYTTGSSPEQKMAAGEIFRQAQRRLLQPDLVQAEALPALQNLNLPLNPSFWERLLGYGGIAANIAGAGIGSRPQPNVAGTPQNFYALNR